MDKEIPTPELIKYITANIYSVGVAIDAPLRCRDNEDGNSLLHFAVMYELYDDVEQILNLGGSSTRKNTCGLSPKDIAVDQGNQIMIQMLGRRDKYRKQHLERTDSTGSDNDVYTPTKVVEQSELTCNIKCCFDSRAISSSSCGSEPFNFAETDDKVLEWRYDAEDVHEDYLDWTDSTRAKRLQNTLEKLRAEESSLQKDIKDYAKNKENTMRKLTALVNMLRESEHNYCLQIWNVVEEERKSRAELQKGSVGIASCKQTLQMLKKKILWTGKVLVRDPKYSFFSVSWNAMTVNIGAEFLTFSSESDARKIAHIPPECVQSVVIREKEVVLHIEENNSRLHDISKSFELVSSHSNGSSKHNPTDVTIVLSFSQCQTSVGSKAIELSDCVRFLNAMSYLNHNIRILVVSANGDVTSYRPSITDDSGMTSLESLTLSSTGTLKDENEELDTTLPMEEENEKEDKFSQKSEGGTSDSAMVGHGLNTGNISSDIDGSCVAPNNDDHVQADFYPVNVNHDMSGFNEENECHESRYNRCRAPSEGDLASLVGANYQDECKNLYSEEKTQTVSSEMNLPKLCKTCKKPGERSCSLSLAGRNSVDFDGNKRAKGDRRTISAFDSRPKKQFAISDLPTDSPHNILCEHPGKSLARNTHEEGLMFTIERFTMKVDHLRAERSLVESRLVKAISERENLLGILHYLQSLKALVSNPPQVPSRLVGTVSLPSIDKAIAAYSECKERMDKAIDENYTVDIDESQLFIASMLEQTCGDEKSRNDSAAVSRNDEMDKKDMYDIPIASNNKRRSSRVKSSTRRLGPPPKEILREFESVIAALEELWTIDISTFETVDKLSQILLLRDRTWKSLSALQVDSSILSQSLDDSDLFDVVI